MYAPNPFEPGSSVSHVNQADYAGIAVMTPALVNGVAIHAPSAFALGMMKDMGWKIATGGGSSAMASGHGGDSAAANSFANGDESSGSGSINDMFAAGLAALDQEDRLAQKGSQSTSLPCGKSPVGAWFRQFRLQASRESSFSEF